MPHPAPATPAILPPPGAPADAWRRRIPNSLTMIRVALAAIFIAALSLYRHPDQHAWALPVGALLFLIAAATVALVGFLARRWRVVSLFGRVMDPFADKVLVLGAFIVLAGPSFVSPDSGRVVSGVAPWMAALILARELLDTSIRAAYESQGVNFAASISGKLKMLFQSGVVPAVLALVWLAPPAALEGGWAWWTANALVWATVAITLLSAWPYIAKAAAARPAADPETPGA